MTEQWQELRETITELRDNDGTGTQQEVCKFLVNYMEVLEKQMEPKTGHWIESKDERGCIKLTCSCCGYGSAINSGGNFCRDCGARMVESQESEGEE